LIKFLVGNILLKRRKEEREKQERKVERYACKGEVTRRGITRGPVFTYYLHYMDCGELSFSNPFSGISVDVLLISRLSLLALLRCGPHCTSETS